MRISDQEAHVLFDSYFLHAHTHNSCVIIAIISNNDEFGENQSEKVIKYEAKISVHEHSQLRVIAPETELIKILKNARNFEFFDKQQKFVIRWKVLANEYERDEVCQINMQKVEIGRKEYLEYQVKSLKKRLADSQIKEPEELHHKNEKQQSHKIDESDRKSQNIKKCEKIQKKDVSLNKKNENEILDLQPILIEDSHEKEKKRSTYKGKRQEKPNEHKIDLNHLKPQNKQQKNQKKKFLNNTSTPLNIKPTLKFKKRSEKQEISYAQEIKDDSSGSEQKYFKEPSLDSDSPQKILNQFKKNQTKTAQSMQKNNKNIKITEREQWVDDKKKKISDKKQRKKEKKKSKKKMEDVDESQSSGQGIKYKRVIVGDKVRIDFKNGDYYFGEVKGDLYHGKGYCFSKQFGTYEGDWKESKREGFGQFVDTDNNKYVGEYKKDKKNGKGTEYYSNGERYEGQFKDDDKFGFGTYYFVNGDKYCGEWKKDIWHGKGKQFFANGSYYQGSWVKDQRQGEGIWMNDGLMIKQMFQNGKLIDEQIVK